MNPFFLGFFLSFLLLLLLLIILRLTIPYASKLFGFIPIPYKSNKESTEWLNFIIHRVLSHYQSRESIEQITKFINEKIFPNEFYLINFGNPPKICNVSTIQLPDPKEIKIFFPIEWKNGPSFNIFFPLIKSYLECDLKLFTGSIMIYWPLNNEINFEIHFYDDINFDFEFNFIFNNKIKFSFTKIPLIGPILKGFIPFFLLKYAIKFKGIFLTQNE